MIFKQVIANVFEYLKLEIPVNRKLAKVKKLFDARIDQIDFSNLSKSEAIVMRADLTMHRRV